MARRRKPLPDDVEVRINDISHDGRGVGKVDGKTVFVVGALPDERVRMQYTSVKRAFDEGIAIEVLQASSQRVAPRCPYFGVCGGCILQHLNPDAQIAYKQTVLEQNFLRIGKISPEHWLPPLRAPHWGYRRKARLSVRNVSKKGRVLVGFRERAGRYVTDMRSCDVLTPDVGQRLEQLSDLIGDLDARDQIPQLEVAAGDATTVLVLRHLAPLSEADHEKLRIFERQTGLEIWLQPGGLTTVHALSGTGSKLSFSLPDHSLEMQFTPLSFVQVNSALNQRMIALVVAKLALEDDAQLLDLFCGLGNFTLPLARHCRHVLALEGDVELVELARHNAQHNGIDNATFEVADLSQDHSGSDWMHRDFDRVLIDPPRSGAEPLLAPLARIGPKRLVYVSCHPGSLARDAGILVHEHGYRLLEAGVMDMFPHTAHVESIAVFERAS